MIAVTRFAVALLAIAEELGGSLLLCRRRDGDAAEDQQDREGGDSTKTRSGHSGP